MKFLYFKYLFIGEDQNFGFTVTIHHLVGFQLTIFITKETNTFKDWVNSVCLVLEVYFIRIYLIHTLYEVSGLYN